MTAKSIAVALALTFGALLTLTPSSAKSAEPVVYYFGAAGCDYCANGLAFLTRWKIGDQRLAYRVFDIVESSDAATTFVRITQAIGLADPRVPMTIVGHHVFVGYEGDDSTGEEIKLAVEQCRTKPCADIVEGLMTLGAEAVAASRGWIVHRRFANAAMSK